MICTGYEERILSARNFEKEDGFRNLGSWRRWKVLQADVRERDRQLRNTASRFSQSTPPPLRFLSCNIMARHTQIFQTELPEEVITAGAAALTLAGFNHRPDLQTWNKGNGLLVAPQYIILLPVEGGVQMEAWLKFALLPAVYFGEFDLEGSFMLIPKRQLRATVAKVVEAIESAGGVEI